MGSAQEVLRNFFDDQQSGRDAVMSELVHSLSGASRDFLRNLHKTGNDGQKAAVLRILRQRTGQSLSELMQDGETVKPEVWHQLDE